MTNKINPTDLKPGTQIIYVPNHAIKADGTPDRTHKDCEYGFVIYRSSLKDAALCAFYNQHNAELRTKANGEWAHFDNLVKCNYYSQQNVDADLATLLRAINPAMAVSP